MATAGMTEAELRPMDRSNLRIFRQTADEARTALKNLAQPDEGFSVVGGFVQSETRKKRTRELCIPVRRVYLPKDPVNLEHTLDLVCRYGSGDLQARVDEWRKRYVPIQEELDSASILGGRPITHAEIFETWVDAVVFNEIPEKTKPFQAMEKEFGKVVEGIGFHLAERIAGMTVEADEIVGALLEG